MIKFKTKLSKERLDTTGDVVKDMEVETPAIVHPPEVGAYSVVLASPTCISQDPSYVQ